MTKVFTEDEVIKLCAAIRERPSLYDPSDANFGKSLANKLVWDEIGAMFKHKQFSADDVKLKWKNLRDTMALLLRKSNRDPNTWRFYEYCSFLNNYERPPRKKLPSAALTNNGDTSTGSLKSSGSDATDTVDDPQPPPEKIAKPTMVVSAKTEEIVEQSDSSRDSNFDDTHDSLLKHFTAAASNDSATRSSGSTSSALPTAASTTTTLVQTPVSSIQSPYPSYHGRDVFDAFGEETAMRLRQIYASGRRTLLIHARRKINDVLDQVELELASTAKSNSQLNDGEN